MSESQALGLQAEVIAIGDELTTGQRLDTNTQWLSQRLGDLGVRVVRHTTVADDLDENVAAFRGASRRVDLVIATGGLGPTADDLTRDAIADAAGVPLRIDPAQLAHVEHLFRSRGRVMPPQNARQAEFPVGANPIPNPGGTAPGIDIVMPAPLRARVFALPGVPAEMRQMWDLTVAPAIRAMRPDERVVRHYLMKCFGVGESTLEGMVPGLIDREREPRVGITASLGTISLRITSSATDEAACRLAIEPTLNEVRAALGNLVFAEGFQGEASPLAGVLTDDFDLAACVVHSLSARGESVATIEAWTAGELARSLALADPGLGAFRGGEVVAATERGADDGTAAAASRLRRERGVDYALAIGPLVEESRVANSVVALATPEGVEVKRSPVFGHPSIHHPWAAKLALNLLRLRLSD
ncbi:MAG: competence/damage-inducible protein A [Lacipirellulaceae bacterium]